MGFIIFAIMIVLVDLCIKNKICEMEESSFPQNLCKGKVIIDRVKNHGLAFGTLKKDPDKVKIITTSVLITVSILFIPMLLIKKVSPIKKAGLSLILGGAACNVADRYIRGYVVDYVRFRIKGKDVKLTFNISDFCIFIGAVVATIGEIFHR